MTLVIERIGVVLAQRDPQFTRTFTACASDMRTVDGMTGSSLGCGDDPKEYR